jgi:hypothetical protein
MVGSLEQFLVEGVACEVDSQGGGHSTAEPMHRYCTKDRDESIAVIRTSIHLSL